VAIEPAAAGDSTAFALSLAATRPVLAAAHAANTRLSDILRLRITRACLASAALFAVSCVVPEPFRYVLWLVAIGIESGALLQEDREAARRARREHDFSTFTASEDPAARLDPHDFAERFGLFLASTRSFLELRGRRRATILRVLVLLATFALWRLEEPLGPHGYVWLLAVWVAGCAAVTTRLGHEAERRASALLARRRANA